MKLKKLFSLVSFLFLSALASYACINEETTMLKDGTIISEERPGGIIPYGHIFYEHNYQKKLKELDNMWKRTQDIDYLSDYGIVLILLKRYEEAKEVFIKIETLKPGRYSTASNLGTAYELIGDNENALKWIKKSVEIDPASHNNSEWLHVKILEAKIKGEQFVTGDFLLNTSFGTAPEPKSTLSNEALLQLRNELYYQLNERVSFIKTKDKIVAALLFELGNVCLLTNAKPQATIILNKAREYGYSDPLLETRLAIAKGEKIQVKDVSNLENKEPVLKEKNTNYLAWTIAVVLALIILFTIARQLRKNPVA